MLNDTAQSNEDEICNLIEEFWALVEKHKDEGPGPVLRALAMKVIAEREQATRAA